MPSIEMNLFGGGNWADQPEDLWKRCFAPTGDGFQTEVPMEASDLENVDIVDGLLAKRRGSAVIDNLTSVMVASEELIRGIRWRDSIDIIVGKKSIYTNQSGSWARINDSTSTAYSHAADVSKVSFGETDGHLFIFLDGANKIQVYKAGADLDAALDNGTTYEEIYSGTNTVTGTWGTGYYIGGVFHGRLVFSTGNSVLEYTDVNEPWDRLSGGFWKCKGNIIAVATFTPRALSNPIEYLFIFTTAGLQILAGGTFAEPPMSYPGVIQPVNHQCVVQTKDWLMWMHIEKGVQAGNLYGVIDIGRRFLNGDGSTGPLDTWSASNSAQSTKPFGFWNALKKQARWMFPDSTRSTNSHELVVDMALGEPVGGEDQPSFEQRVRCFYNSIKDPATNAWFTGAYRIRNGYAGVLASGYTYTLDSGRNDLDTIAIQSFWISNHMSGGTVIQGKNFNDAIFRFKEIGDWGSEIYSSTDYDQSFLLSGTITQLNNGTTVYGTGTYGTSTYTAPNTVKAKVDVDRYGDALRIKIENNDAGEYWYLYGISQNYNYGAVEA